MKMQNLKFTLLLLLLGAWHVKAQDLSEIYNPNLFLGTVDVNIPIYEQGGIGARLSYNTKGVPVREMAGVAGLHWNLVTGGAITRSIKGLPDEANYKAFFNRDINFFFDAAHEAIVGLYYRYCGRLYEASGVDNVTFTDPESDEYQFSVGSKSFTFYFGRNGQLFTNPKNKFDVMFLYNGVYISPEVTITFADFKRYPIDNIKVVDRADNSTYYFSISERRKGIKLPEYFLDGTLSQFAVSGNNYFHIPEKPFPIAWKLDSVIVNNKKTTLSYKTFRHHGVWDSSYVYNNMINISPQQKDDTFYFVDKIIYPNNIQLNFNYKSNNPARADLNINGTYSNLTDAYPLLSDITLKQNDNQIRYKFDYSYFYSSGPNFESNLYVGGSADQYSLKLKGITKQSSDSSEAFNLYRFGYISKKPRRFAKGLDAYGYYNGGDEFMNAIGHSIYKHDISFLKAFKGNHISATYGLLNSIENGYGGKVEFKYGLHNNISNVPSVLQPTGADVFGNDITDGVRIDSIVTTEKFNPGKRDLTYFSYSNGQRFVSGGYSIDGISYTGTNGYDRVTNIYETFVSPSLLYYGNNHGYSNVTVIYQNSNNHFMGKTEYRFSNFKDNETPPKVLTVGGGKSQLNPYFTQKQYIKDWEMGLPLSIKQFDNKGLLISETKNDYVSILDTTSAMMLQINDTARRVNIEAGLLYDLQDPSYGSDNYDISNFSVHKDPYRPYRGQSLLSKSVTYTYESDARKMADSVVYHYDDRNNQKYSVVWNSRGEMIRSINVYNYDLSKSTVLANPTLSSLANSDREILIGTERWKRPSSSLPPAGPLLANEKLLNTSVFTFGLQTNGSLAPVSVYTLEAETPVLGTDYREGMLNPSNPGYIAFSQVAKAWNNPAAMPGYMSLSTEARLFDANGNVTQAYIPGADQYKVNIFHKTNFNKIVEVANAKLNEVAFADFDNNIDGNLFFNQGHIYLPNTLILNADAPVVTAPISKTVSGRGVLAIAASGSGHKPVYVQGLSSGKQYRATFWATANHVPQFGIENGIQFTLTELAARGGFKQYEVLFHVAPGQQWLRFGINSPNGNIGLEDIRICPADAAMQNTTYEALFGVASVTDALGRITYFEYDKLGRLVITRDQDGNILEKKEYGAQ